MKKISLILVEKSFGISDREKITEEFTYKLQKPFRKIKKITFVFHSDCKNKKNK